MAQNIVKIDDRYFNIVIPQGGLQRSFSVVDTDNSGRGVNGNMIRDIVGTYYNYGIAFDTRLLDVSEYDALYEILSAPVDSHSIIVPYGQKTLAFDAYVTNGSDSLLRVDSAGNHWKGLSINFTAMNPQRRQ